VLLIRYFTSRIWHLGPLIKQVRAISNVEGDGDEYPHPTELVEHLRIHLNGAAFHVARGGQGSPLLLLHGWPEYWLTWESVMVRLEESVFS
jgi:hypothetical protein